MAKFSLMNTTTTVGAAVGSFSVSTITYGTPNALTATVAPSSGNTPPLPVRSISTTAAPILAPLQRKPSPERTQTSTLATAPNQLQVIQANLGIHTIIANYSPGSAFNGSTGTLAGGLQVAPAPLTITATTNTKTYDSTTTATALPTVSGLDRGHFLGSIFTVDSADAITVAGAEVWVGGGPNTSDISIFGTDGMFVRTLSTGASAAAIAVVAGQVWVGGGTNTSGISVFGNDGTFLKTIPTVILADAITVVGAEVWARRRSQHVRHFHLRY